MTRIFRSARFHLVSTIGWIVIGAPLCWYLKDSIPWIVFMSWYAIVKTDWAAYQAARSEETQVEIKIREARE